MDDIEINRTLLVKMLEPIGLKVREAVNGEEAITLFNEWSPPVVLMEKVMPVMDGLEATRQI